MNLTENRLISTRVIMFTCVQCGHRDSCDRWSMTCPRCWVPMMPGTPETWWVREPLGKRARR